MEQRKPRNRKGINKSVKPKDESPKLPPNPKTENTETGDVSFGIKKLTPEDYDYVNSDKTQFAHLKRETQSDTSEKNPGANPHARRKVLSNWGKYEEIPDTETPGKDFQSLLNVPISQGGHFAFKSEKNWAIEVTKYSDLFSLNVKKLARDIDCIPFTEYIGVEEKYFTVDQLTRFHNLAEKSRTFVEVDVTETLLNCLKEIVPKNQEIDGENEDGETDETPKKIEGEKVEEDLDFLLSLKEPVRIDQPRIPPAVYQTHAEEEKTQASAAPVKSIDLEKWLDSILDS